ncbi:MAG: hypothetical protein HQK89_14675 [Nitrospirae bacterium]|nr:hypothetical protein [Nitrospirota bacterium]
MVNPLNGQTTPVTSDTANTTQQAQSGKRSHGGHHHKKAAGSGQTGTAQSSGQAGTSAQTNTAQGNTNPDVILNLSSAATATLNNNE